MKQPETLTQLLTERKEENGTYVKTQSKQLPISTSSQTKGYYKASFCRIQVNLSHSADWILPTILTEHAPTCVNIELRCCCVGHNVVFLYCFVKQYRFIAQYNIVKVRCQGQKKHLIVWIVSGTTRTERCKGRNNICIFQELRAFW